METYGLTLSSLPVKLGPLTQLKVAGGCSQYLPAETFYSDLAQCSFPLPQVQVYSCPLYLHSCYSPPEGRLVIHWCNFYSFKAHFVAHFFPNLYLFCPLLFLMTFSILLIKQLAYLFSGFVFREINSII